jgi:5'-nucleotidase
VRIAIVTARNSPAELRVIKTLRHWGVYANEIFFLGGIEKTKVLKAFRPHIFFDDQDVHLDPAARHVPSGKVPYKSGSPLCNPMIEHESAADPVALSTVEGDVETCLGSAPATPALAQASAFGDDCELRSAE